MSTLELSYVRNKQDTHDNVSVTVGDPLVCVFKTPTSDKMNPGGTGGSLRVTRGGNAPAVDFTLSLEPITKGPAQTVSINFNTDPKIGLALKPETEYHATVTVSADTAALVTLSAR